MAYNKFITQDGVVALDLTEDTITAETLEKGITAHDKHGVLIVGTMESGEVLEEYDGTVIIGSDFNLALSGVYQPGSTLHTDYLKINSAPSSDTDYDYSARTLATNGSVTVKATSYWFWDNDYTSAKETTLTADTQLTLYYTDGGSND